MRLNIYNREKRFYYSDNFLEKYLKMANNIDIIDIFRARLKLKKIQRFILHKLNYPEGPLMKKRKIIFSTLIASL